MTRRVWVSLSLAALLVVAMAVAGCGASAPTNSTTTSATSTLVTTTAAGTKPVPSVTWALYRDVNTLDPDFAFDDPENTAVTLMCESLLRQAPDGSVGPGLATLAIPTPTTYVFTLRPGVKFWDGNPVTPADVVFSITRQMDPKVGGFYQAMFTRVQLVQATGANQVTITLKQPDYWLEGELSSIPGIVLERSFVEKEGKNYGAPGGSIMGTGAFMLKSWNTANGVVAIPNPHYWDASVKTPLVQQIVLRGFAGTASLSSGLLTGSIQGSYPTDLATLLQLQQSGAVKVYQGRCGSTDALVICSFKGALGDVRVRQALSLALDRQAVIDSVYHGAAQLPRWLANPGTFGYGQSVFSAAYDSSPAMKQDVAKAKQLIQQAGAAGTTITIGMSSGMPRSVGDAAAYQAAGEAIGLNVKFRAVSPANFINFFIDPKFREGVDAFPTTNYGDYADPAALLKTVVLPDGSQNFSGFSDPKTTSLLDQARSTADPDQRASLVAKAEEAVAQQLPWIPTVQPNIVLVLGKGLTGAVPTFSYMFAPWANQLGGR